MASFINFFVGIIATILLTRLFEPHLYGIWNIFISTANFIMFFACFGLNDAFIRFSVEKPYSDNKNKLFTICVVKSMLFFFIIAIVVMLLWVYVSEKLFQVQSISLVIMLLIYSFVLLLLNRFMINYFRVVNDVKKYTVLQVGGNTFCKLFVLLCIFVATDVCSVLFFQTLGVGLFVIIVFVKYRKLIFDINIKDISLSWQIYKFAFISWINSSIFQFGTFVMPVVITSVLGSYAFGIYSSTNLFNSVVSVFASAFTAYWSVFMFKYYQNEQKKIKQVHDFVLFGCICFMLTMILLQNEAYLFLGDAYKDSRMFFSFVVGSALINFLNETTHYGIIIMKHLHEYTIIYILYFAINIIFALCLMPIYGIAGAAIASMVASIFRFLLLTWRGQYYYKSIDSYWRTSGGIIILCMMTCLNYVLYDKAEVYLFAVVLFVGSVFLYKNFLVKAYELINHN